MYTEELGRQLDGTGVTVSALNPGFNVTGLGRELGFSSVLAKILNVLHIGDRRRGAEEMADVLRSVQPIRNWLSTENR